MQDVSIYPGPPQDTDMQDVFIVSRYILGYRDKDVSIVSMYTLGYRYVGCIQSILVHPMIQRCRMYLQYPGPPQDTEIQDVSIESRYTLGYRYVQDVTIVSRSTLGDRYEGCVYTVSRYTLGYRYVQDESKGSRYTLGYRDIWIYSIQAQFMIQRYRMDL